MRRIAAALVVGGYAFGWTAPALAYRPFDGTDAAVADFGEVEIELQPGGVVHPGSPSTFSDAVFNYGFAERWELVVQGTAPMPQGDVGPLSTPDAVLFKYVVLPGVLQGKPGPSVATEFGALLPDSGGTTPGVSWTGIVSQRWEWGTVHLNVETNLTPDQHGELFLDAIVEGPIKWTVRPVLELYFDNVFNQTQAFSGLVGAIWQVRDNLAFDIGLRYALVNGRPVNELRAGLTFGFPVNLARPVNAYPSSAAPFNRP